MVEVLKPFLETMDIVCGYTASLGQVIPLIHALNQSLETAMAPGSSLLPRTRALMKRLEAGVQKLLHLVYRNRAYCMACLCGPRIKGGLAACTSDLEEWRMELYTKVLRALGAQRLCEATAQGHEGQGGLPEPQEMTSPGEGSIHHHHYWSSVVTLALASEERQPAG